MIYIETNGTIGILRSFHTRNMKLFSKIAQFQNLTFFDLFRPDLVLDFYFYDKINLNGILTLSFESYVEFGPQNMCHMT